ncbi:MAG TPA: hypothetical protein PK366_04805, partial [Fibrobacteraceae bacterium]|nr:hypothetical protein [Fibrobacteraceae bacterium]
MTLQKHLLTIPLFKGFFSFTNKPPHFLQDISKNCFDEIISEQLALNVKIGEIIPKQKKIAHIEAISKEREKRFELSTFSL